MAAFLREFNMRGKLSKGLGAPFITFIPKKERQFLFESADQLA